MILRVTRSVRAAGPAHALLYTPVMNKLLAVALTLPLVACVVGSDPGPATGDDTGSGGSGGGGGGGGGGGTAGHITANTTWTGAMDITVATTIDPGVTVTVAAGTVITLKSGVGLDVQGILDAQGTKASPIKIAPTAAGMFHSGVGVPTGGEIKYSYVVQTGGGVLVSGGKATIVDTKMSNASGDFLVMSAGILDVSYSQIGLDEGVIGDSTHCDMHFGGGTIKITHSNIGTSSYGVMFYGGTGAIYTNDNWYGNQIDFDVSPGSGVTGDLTGSWFKTTAPTAKSGTTITGLGALPNAKLADAGVR